MKEKEDEAIILFEEVQQFARRSVWDFLKGLLGIVFFALVIGLLVQGGKMTDYNKLLVILLPILLVGNIIFSSRLIMHIRGDGIYVRFPPWQARFTVYQWTDIEKIYVREYRPMKEFMGWGIRYGPRKMGYIVAGNSCIEIDLKNGGTIIITTQRGEEVSEVLKSMGV